MAPSHTPLTSTNAANIHRPRRAEPLRRLLLKSQLETQKHVVVLSKGVRRRRLVPKAAASLRSPKPPRQQLTPEQLLATARRLAASRTIHSADFDHAFADEVVSLLAPVDVNVPGRLFYPADALRKTCQTLQLTHWPPYSKYDVDRYIDTDALGTRNEMKMPFIWLNNLNAYGIDAIRTGAHGFAWMSSIDSANLDLVQAFHLLNSPGPVDQWKQRKWNYCGKYYAQRTGYYMSVDGFKHLPRATREAAAAIRAGHPSNKGSTSEEMYAQFDSGELGVELVIFQFCGLPSTKFSDALDREVALAIRPAKPPRTPPKKLDRENIFAKHPETYEAWQRIQDNMNARHRSPL